MKRFFIPLLAVMLVFTLALPAMAAEVDQVYEVEVTDWLTTADFVIAPGEYSISFKDSGSLGYDFTIDSIWISEEDWVGGSGQVPSGECNLMITPYPSKTQIAFEWSNTSYVPTGTLTIAPVGSRDRIYIGAVNGRIATFSDVPEGYYFLRVYTNSDCSELLAAVPAFIVTDGNHSYKFANLTSVFDDVSLQVSYDQDSRICTIIGESDHLGNAHFDLFGSMRYPNTYAELVLAAEILHPASVSVFDVFAGIGAWLFSSLSSLSGIFWIESTGTLTILGTLAVSALGIGIVLGLFAIIIKFLKFRS